MFYFLFFICKTWWKHMRGMKDEESGESEGDK